MKIRHSALLVSGGLCLTLATPIISAELPTAEELFARHREAIGGDALDEVKNVVSEFTFSMPAMGLVTEGKSFAVPPDKSYSMISLASMGASDFESGVNGDVVWQNNPQLGLRLLDGNERRMSRRAAWVDPFEGWKTLWEKAETVAEESLGDSAAYKVVLTPAEGDPLTVWFDKETGLLLQEKMAGPPEMPTPIVTTFGDYRAVDGVKTAHRVEQRGAVGWVLEVTSLRVNVDDLPEDVFEVPARIGEMATE